MSSWVYGLVETEFGLVLSEVYLVFGKPAFHIPVSWKDLDDDRVMVLTDVIDQCFCKDKKSRWNEDVMNRRKDKIANDFLKKKGLKEVK